MNMNLSEQQRRKSAKSFSKYWKDKGYEKGESHKFWLELLRTVYGVEKPEHYIEFEDKVHIDHTSFIDGYIPETKVLIEQKGLDKSLRKAITQSDGSKLTPFQQAKRYSAELPYSRRPRWIVTSNFSEFLIYDMENPNAEPEELLLKNLEKEYYRLDFLVDTGNENVKKEMEISIKAGEIVGKLYDTIRNQYVDPNNEQTLKSLNMLCVRLVFCFYAEDAGVFGSHLMFHNYLSEFDARHFRNALIELFEVLNTKISDRDPYLDDKLVAFPYVNGGLFAQKNIEIPQFTDEIRELILRNASEEFDWSEISPTIFGALFESTLNPKTRRKGGMHYTSVENIHKVIDPLFLDDLKVELEKIKQLKQEKTREKKLEEFTNKLSSLKFLDPACGSGNFLTETYISLRKLENEALSISRPNQISFDNLIKVKINQFYGIEINDFAVTVAKTALWIAESQMIKETEDIVNTAIDFLPLTTNAFIVEENALRVDWETVVPKSELSYIMGNPPFVGARVMDENQKADVASIFGNLKGVGNLDYVSCWYKKCADFMKDTCIQSALVSTNSITQGEQPAILFKSIFAQGTKINFAYRTFRWDSETSEKAHVHCVIVGFSNTYYSKPKVIFASERPTVVSNINAYLVESDDVFVESRKSPLCDIPNILFGNMPNDNGFLSDYSEIEKNEIVNKYPEANKMFKRFVGASEFINNKVRWCLWLKDISPSLIRKIPPIYEAVLNVKKMRESSKRLATQKLADVPMLFGEIRQPDTDYIIIPCHSSENRRYIPLGYETKDIICSNANLMIPNASLYYFGVLTSNVHNAWIRTVAGRLEMRFRYSANIVYNNFPWPNPNEKQKEKIEQTAQAILDARAKHPECSLADLYDELSMPPDLRKAHQENDKAVMQAYGFDYKTMTESECVAKLMNMYQDLVEKSNK